MRILPSDGRYTTFCDLVTGYRTVSVIMEAVDSGLIDNVGEGCAVGHLLETSGFREEEGRRFIAMLVGVGILEEYGGLLYLSQFSRRYLLKEGELSQRNVLEFEKLLMERWRGVDSVLRRGQGALVTDQSPAEYRRRLTLFQGAMGEAALVRAKELWDAVAELPETGLIIDVGAGDCTYLAEFLRRHSGWSAVACDLPDVLASDGAGVRDPGIQYDDCNILDPGERAAFVSRRRGTASVLLLSNFVHCYSEGENVAIIGELRDLLNVEGVLIVHDFFRDGNGFGALYDIHMMVNTYNGRTFTFDETVRMLGEAGFGRSAIVELPSWSHAIIARQEMSDGVQVGSLFGLRRLARSLGFFAVAEIDPAGIGTEPWVEAKCRYGCRFYGRKWSCPPHSLSSGEFSKLAGSYSKGLVVAGHPPLRDFQEKLLELEKGAFLAGFKKALAFTGGPCSWCENCDDDRCLFPEKRRPSLESCGCDVFALAERSGIPVAPLKKSDDFVQYIGMVLVE